MSKQLIICIASIFISMQVFAYPAMPSKCHENNDSLSGDELLGRNAWVLKCYPEFQGIYKSAEDFIYTDPSGFSVRIYFTFVHVDENGEKTSISAPISVDAPCWDKTIYKAAGFCRP